MIPKILYSSLIAIVLNKLFKLLASSNSRILQFKQNKKTQNINKLETDLIDKLNTKFIIYFIISFLFLLCFWYYLSMFGAIYKNTQYHLLKNTLISFPISLLYPFIFYLLPGLFRFLSLSNRQNKKECFYSCSKVLQII